MVGELATPLAADARATVLMVRGTSEGAFDGGRREKYDVRAAIQCALDHRLPDPWLVGWSFGADVIAEHGCGPRDIRPYPAAVRSPGQS